MRALADTTCLRCRRPRRVKLKCEMASPAPAVRLTVRHEVATPAEEQALERRACADRVAFLHDRIALMRRVIEHGGLWAAETRC